MVAFWSSWMLGESGRWSPVVKALLIITMIIALPTVVATIPVIGWFKKYWQGASSCSGAVRGLITGLVAWNMLACQWRNCLREPQHLDILVSSESCSEGMDVEHLFSVIQVQVSLRHCVYQHPFSGQKVLGNLQRHQRIVNISTSTTILLSFSSVVLAWISEYLAVCCSTTCSPLTRHATWTMGHGLFYGTQVSTQLCRLRTSGIEFSL